MSLVFSDTTNKSGIIQQLERKCGFNDGDISGNPLRMAQFTADINLAMDNVSAKIFKLGGTWQFDDSNHTGYPIITTDLVAGQRDYSFVADSEGNLILGIYKVMVLENGKYKDITPVDQQSQTEDVRTLTNGEDTTGSVTRYDKTANGIFLDLVPEADVTDGLKMYINRESTYFTVSDTTKKPGFDGLVHEYIVLDVAYKYARDKRLANRVDLKEGLAMEEIKLNNRYGKRQRDISRDLKPYHQDNR